MERRSRKDTDSTWFWKNVKRTDSCWLWARALDGKKYGRIMLSGGGYERAHRFSWAEHFGTIPQGKHVLHNCDVRHCVNPNHLFLGTNDTNVADRNQKKRQARDEKHGSAKLTMEKAKEIRDKYETGNHSTRELGLEYGVAHTQISKVVRNLRWVGAA